jgi:hypothetical protein
VAVPDSLFELVPRPDDPPACVLTEQPNLSGQFHPCLKHTIGQLVVTGDDGRPIELDGVFLHQRFHGWRYQPALEILFVDEWAAFGPAQNLQ